MNRPTQKSRLKSYHTSTSSLKARTSNTPTKSRLYPQHKYHHLPP
jgi:hypothetical protein